MLGLILRFVLDARAASLAIGGPWLVDVCERESHCTAIDVHDGDRWLGRRAWVKAVRVGWLDPASCPWHRWDAGPWSTRGAHGQIAAYALRHLPISCVPPSALAIPAVSALAAVARADAWECDAVAACRRWRS